MRLRGILFMTVLFYVFLFFLSWTFAPEARGDAVIVGLQDGEMVNLYVSEYEEMTTTTGYIGDGIVNVLQIDLESDPEYYDYLSEYSLTPEDIGDPLESGDLE